jgi:hypothetical protein
LLIPTLKWNLTNLNIDIMNYSLDRLISELQEIRKSLPCDSDRIELQSHSHSWTIEGIKSVNSPVKWEHVLIKIKKTGKIKK